MISELLPEEKRKLNELEFQLSQLELNQNCPISPSDIHTGLLEMDFRIIELEKLADKESKTRREDYRRRIQQLRNIHQHIRISLDVIVKRKYPAGYNYSEQRRQLFAGADVEGGGGSGGYSQSEIDVSNSLDRSSSMVNSYLDAGRNTLNELLSQKERMKNVHRNVLDMMNYLGLSNSIMKAVENRDLFDRILVYGGMIFVVFLLLFIWIFIKKR